MYVYFIGIASLSKYEMAALEPASRLCGITYRLHSRIRIAEGRSDCYICRLSLHARGHIARVCYCESSVSNRWIRY